MGLVTDIDKQLCTVLKNVESRPQPLAHFADEIHSLHVILLKISNSSISTALLSPGDPALEHERDRLQPLLAELWPILGFLRNLLAQVDKVQVGTKNILVYRLIWLHNKRKIEGTISEIKSIRRSLTTQLLLRSQDSVQQSINLMCQLNGLKSANGSSEHLLDTMNKLFERQIEPEIKDTLMTRPPICLTRNSTSECAQGCNCRCHSRWSLKTSRKYQEIFGWLRLRVQGFCTSACDQVDCMSDYRSSCILECVFPQWLLRRIIRIALLRQKNLGFTIQIRFPLVRPSNSEIFQCCEKGDLGRIGALFVSGAGGPNDMDLNLDTALHKAIRYGSLEVCEFLLKVGADAYAMNIKDKTPADMAWDRIIADVADPALRRLFCHCQDVLLQRQFSRVHLAVFGLNNFDIAQVLEQDSSGINKLDSHGRTPLYWAARRGDSSMVKVLLGYGADPNYGTSPIAWSCGDRYEAPNCLESLLEAGADPDKHDTDGHTALQACGIFGKTLNFVDLLMCSGARIDKVYDGKIDHLRGITSLGFACLNGHISMLKILLSNGANVDWQDESGRTALHLALQRPQGYACSKRSSRVVEKLLTWHPNLEIRDHQGLNPACLAISMNEVESLGRLMDHGSIIVHSQYQLYPENGYCMLAWPFENRRYPVVEFLLHRSEVNIYDRHPETNDSLLHLAAKYSDTRLLVTIEEVADSYRLEADIVNAAGLTPADCFNERFKTYQKTQISLPHSQKAQTTALLNDHGLPNIGSEKLSIEYSNSTFGNKVLHHEHGVSSYRSEAGVYGRRHSEDLFRIKDSFLSLLRRVREAKANPHFQDVNERSSGNIVVESAISYPSSTASVYSGHERPLESGQQLRRRKARISPTGIDSASVTDGGGWEFAQNSTDSATHFSSAQSIDAQDLFARLADIRENRPLLYDAISSSCAISNENWDLEGYVSGEDDSEAEITLMAWQTQGKGWRERRRDRGYDSGYGSAKSDYSTEDETNSQMEPHKSIAPEDPAKAKEVYKAPDSHLFLYREAARLSLLTALGVVTPIILNKLHSNSRRELLHWFLQEIVHDWEIIRNGYNILKDPGAAYFPLPHCWVPWLWVLKLTL